MGSPSNWRCLVVPRTTNISYYVTCWKLLNVWISNKSEFCVDLRQSYLALKLKFVQCRDYQTDSSKEVEKEHKKEVKLDDALKEVAEAPLPLVTLVHNILQSFFSNKEVYINNPQIYNSNGLYPHKFYISKNFKGAIS